MTDWESGAEFEVLVIETRVVEIRVVGSQPVVMVRLRTIQVRAVVIPVVVVTGRRRGMAAVAAGVPVGHRGVMAVVVHVVHVLGRRHRHEADRGGQHERQEAPGRHVAREYVIASWAATT